jgi:hypothetical protein
MDGGLVTLFIAIAAQRRGRRALLHDRTLL